MLKYPKFEDSSFRLGPPGVEDALGAGEVLGGAGGLGGEAATLEPQAPVPTAGTDVVAEDAGRLRPGVLRVEGHVRICG